jgi:AcrR family transcriptional regulator
VARRGNDSELEELLSAARGVLAERGYDGLRVEDVLREAGLSTRAFYRHFSGKAALFLVLFEQESVRANQRLRTRLERAGDASAAVTEWIAGVLALAFDSRLAKRARLFAGDQGALARRFPEEVHKLTTRQLEPLEDAIAAGKAAGLFPGAHPVNDARAIHHLCSGLMDDRLNGTSSLSYADAVALATRFAIHALQADSTPKVAT